MKKFIVLALLCCLQSQVSFTQSTQLENYYSKVDSVFSKDVWNSLNGKELLDLVLRSNSERKLIDKKDEKELRKIIEKKDPRNKAKFDTLWAARSFHLSYPYYDPKTIFEKNYSAINESIDKSYFYKDSFKSLIDSVVHTKNPFYPFYKVYPYLFEKLMTQDNLKSNYYKEFMYNHVLELFSELYKYDSTSVELKKYAEILGKNKEYVNLSDQVILFANQNSNKLSHFTVEYLSLLEKKNEFALIESLSKELFSDTNLNNDLITKELSDIILFYVKYISSHYEQIQVETILSQLDKVIHWNGTNAKSTTINHIAYELHPAADLAEKRNDRFITSLYAIKIKLTIKANLENSSNPIDTILSQINFLKDQDKQHYVKFKNDLFYINLFANYCITNYKSVSKKKKQYKEIIDFMLSITSTQQFYSSKMSDWFNLESKNRDILFQVGEYFINDSDIVNTKLIISRLEKVHKKTAKKLESKMNQIFTYSIPISELEEMFSVKIQSIEVNNNPIKFKKKQKTVEFSTLNNEHIFAVKMSLANINKPIEMKFSTDSLGFISSSIQWEFPDELLSNYKKNDHVLTVATSTAGKIDNSRQKAMMNAATILLEIVNESSVNMKEVNGVMQKRVEGRIKGLNMEKYFFHYVSSLQQYEFFGVWSAPLNQN